MSDTSDNPDFLHPMPDAVYEELKRRAASVSADTSMTVAEARELSRSLRAHFPNRPPTTAEVKEAIARRRALRTADRLENDT